MSNKLALRPVAIRISLTSHSAKYEVNTGSYLFNIFKPLTWPIPSTKTINPIIAIIIFPSVEILKGFNSSITRLAIPSGIRFTDQR